MAEAQKLSAPDLDARLSVRGMATRRVVSQWALAFDEESRFPRNGLLAAWVACLAKAASALWLPEFVRALLSRL